MLVLSSLWDSYTVYEKVGLRNGRWGVLSLYYHSMNELIMFKLTGSWKCSLHSRKRIRNSHALGLYVSGTRLDTWRTFSHFLISIRRNYYIHSDGKRNWSPKQGFLCITWLLEERAKTHTDIKLRDAWNEWHYLAIQFVGRKWTNSDWLGV
jgi:hypothetical protein